jgi:hypothetical protein
MNATTQANAAAQTALGRRVIYRTACASLPSAGSAAACRWTLPTAFQRAIRCTSSSDASAGAAACIATYAAMDQRRGLSSKPDPLWVAASNGVASSIRWSSADADSVAITPSRNDRIPSAYEVR